MKSRFVWSDAYVNLSTLIITLDSVSCSLFMNLDPINPDPPNTNIHT